MSTDTTTPAALAGDWLATRFDPVSVVRYGGLLASLGLMAAVFTTNQFIVLLGFAAVGITPMIPGPVGSEMSMITG